MSNTSLNIVVADNERAFYTRAAWHVIGQILQKPSSVIGLSTGRTTKNIHLQIGEIFSNYPFPVADTSFFGLDEVMNVPREYAGACYTMLKTELMDTLGVRKENFLMLPTQADDFVAACQEFQSELERRGGIDLLLLGLGENGHLGFNQPGSPFAGETWTTDMDETLEERIRRETGTPSDKKLGGVTLGLKNIMHARKLVLLANGERKADIVKRMLQGPVTPDVPASILQLHPCCEFLLDPAAASKL